MADQGTGPKYYATADNSGIEYVPHSGLESAPPDQGYSPGQQTLQPYMLGAYTDPSQPDKTQRILGLSVRTFWIVLIILVVILAGGIGGGVGGGLAARSRADASATTTSDGAATTASSSGEPKTETTSTNTNTPTTTSTTTSSAANNLASPAPTDGGCPSINGTAYTPLDASGKAISLKSGQAQSFRRLCSTNYPSGARYGNPGIHDIIKLWLPSLEDCITACAAYNLAYEENEAGGVGVGGLCRSVAVVKTEGEYCYLKNGTGTNDTFGQPSIYSSAVLLF